MGTREFKTKVTAGTDPVSVYFSRCQAPWYFRGRILCLHRVEWVEGIISTCTLERIKKKKIQATAAWNFQFLRFTRLILLALSWKHESKARAPSSHPRPGNCRVAGSGSDAGGECYSLIVATLSKLHALSRSIQFSYGWVHTVAEAEHLSHTA